MSPGSGEQLPSLDELCAPARLGHRDQTSFVLASFSLTSKGSRSCVISSRMTHSRRCGSREVRRIVCDDDDVYRLGIDVPIEDVGSGETRWSETYDNPGNPLIEIEQAVVWSLMDQIPPGTALDAACQTGRHTRRHVARAKVPDAVFHHGDLTSLPLDSASVDRSYARWLSSMSQTCSRRRRAEPVVRPGGRVVLSDLHPIGTALGGMAYFQDASGGAGVVRGYGHLHGEYLRSFQWLTSRSVKT